LVLNNGLVHDEDEPLDTAKRWMEISSIDFDTYHISALAVISGGTAQAQQYPMMTRTRNVKKSTHDILDRFKKGIKRDASTYSILKDDPAFGTFHSSTFAIARRAQDLHQVFDPGYTPHLHEDIALFEKKQNFVYAHLVTTLRTDQGRTFFVREHTHDVNAQMVYTKLLKHYHDSPTSKTAISSLQKALIPLTLD